MQLEKIVSWLDGQYPAELAEEWDNVGLLLGDLGREVRRVMTCLTVTPEVCREATEGGVELIVSHHPFPFRALRRITSETVDGRMLLQLIGGGVALYSPHTAHDSAEDGINRQLADLLGLEEVRPLNENGSGRIGRVSGLARTLRDCLETVRNRLGPCVYVGDPDRNVAVAALGCGAADGFVEEAVRQGADLLLLGEARFHACLQAQSLGLSLILPGHYASERFAVESLARKLAARFPELDCFASREDREVLHYFEA